MERMTRLSEAELHEITRCLAVQVNRTTRAINRLYEGTLRNAGISVSQLSTLTALAAMGPAPIGKVASALGVDRTTLARNLDVLAQRGLTSLEGNVTDSRSRLAAITPSGEAILAEAHPRWAAAQDRLFAELGLEVDAIRDALVEIEQAADRAGSS